MLCFEVKVNGNVVCTAGIGDFGVLSAILSWVNVHPKRRKYEVDEKEQSGDLFLSVGGVTSQEKGDNEHVRWLNQNPVLPGDEIAIRILNQATCDTPAQRFQGSSEERE